MAIVIDYVNEVIIFTSPTTIADGQTVNDFIDDESVTPVGLLHPYRSQADPNSDTEIIYPEGKIEDQGNPGVFSQIILRLNPRWQMQFFAGSGVTRWRGAKIVGGLGGVSFKASGAAGDITLVETPVDGTLTVVAGTGGATAAEVWQYAIDNGFSAEEILRILAAVVAGKSSGQPNAPVFRDIGDTKDRVSGTVDANGNRTSVVIDET